MKTYLLRAIVLFSISVLSVTGLAIPAHANGVDGSCGAFEFGGGDGSEGSPFLINNQSALNELRDCAIVTPYHYKLTTDLELTGQWTPIENFIGFFDGDEHSIGGIDISTSHDGTGFFNLILAGSVHDLELFGTVENDGNDTGLLAGQVQDATFANLVIHTNVIGIDNTGGAVGFALFSSFTNITVDKFAVNSKVISSGNNTGGIIGELSYSDISSSSANIDVFSDGWNSSLGGIYGSSTRDDLDSTFNQYLKYSGTIKNLANGAYRCGGIAGSSQHSINQSLVTEASIECESHDVGGIVGFSEASVNYSAFDGEIKISPVDEYSQPAAVGGIIGNWAPKPGYEAVNGNTAFFTGTAEWIIGGVIGVLDTTLIESSALIALNDNAVNAEMHNSVIAGGLIGFVLDYSDPSRTEYPSFRIYESYSSVDFLNIVDIYDSVGFWNFDNATITLDHVYYDKTGEGSGTDIPGAIAVSNSTMQRRGWWLSQGFDMTNSWGMMTGFNEGLPVKVDPFPEVQFVHDCEVKNFPKITFANNSAKLTNAAKNKLDDYAAEIIAGTCFNLSVKAYTSGKEKMKKKTKTMGQRTISINRAKAIVFYLLPIFQSADVEVLISQSGLGATHLINKDKTKKQQAANRRAVVSTVS